MLSKSKNEKLKDDKEKLMKCKKKKWNKKEEK